MESDIQFIQREETDELLSLIEQYIISHPFFKIVFPPYLINYEELSKLNHQNLSTLKNVSISLVSLWKIMKLMDSDLHNYIHYISLVLETYVTNQNGENFIDVNYFSLKNLGGNGLYSPMGKYYLKLYQTPATKLETTEGIKDINTLFNLVNESLLEREYYEVKSFSNSNIKSLVARKTLNDKIQETNNNYSQDKPKTIKIIAIDGIEIEVNLTEIEELVQKEDKIYKKISDINQQPHYVDKKKWNELTAKANINGEGNIVIENHKGELITARRHKQKQLKKRKLKNSNNILQPYKQYKDNNVLNYSNDNLLSNDFKNFSQHSYSVDNENKNNLYSTTNLKSPRQEHIAINSKDTFDLKHCNSDVLSRETESGLNKNIMNNNCILTTSDRETFSTNNSNGNKGNNGSITFRKEEYVPLTSRNTQPNYNINPMKTFQTRHHFILYQNSPMNSDRLFYKNYEPLNGNDLLNSKGKFQQANNIYYNQYGFNNSSLDNNVLKNIPLVTLRDVQGKKHFVFKFEIDECVGTISEIGDAITGEVFTIHSDDLITYSPNNTLSIIYPMNNIEGKIIYVSYPFLKHFLDGIEHSQKFTGNDNIVYDINGNKEYVSCQEIDSLLPLTNIYQCLSRNNDSSNNIEIINKQTNSKMQLPKEFLLALIDKMRLKQPISTKEEYTIKKDSTSLCDTKVINPYHIQPLPIQSKINNKSNNIDNIFPYTYNNETSITFYQITNLQLKTKEFLSIDTIISLLQNKHQFNELQYNINELKLSIREENISSAYIQLNSINTTNQKIYMSKRLFNNYIHKICEQNQQISNIGIYGGVKFSIKSNIISLISYIPIQNEQINSLLKNKYNTYIINNSGYYVINSDKNVSAINNDLFEHMIVNDIYGSSFYISKGFIRKQLLNKHKHNLLENLNVIDSAGQRRVISLFAILHNNTA